MPLDHAMEELFERKRKVEAELSGVRKQVKRAKEKTKAVTAAASRAWRLSESVLHTVLIACVLADGAVDPSVVYLRQRGLQFGWPAKTDDELAAMVDDALLAADPDLVVALTDADCAPDKKALERAVSYVRQWRARAWTLQQNLKGVAPSTAAVLAQLDVQRAQAAQGLQPQDWGSSNQGGARKRVSRWRRRFGGRVGKLKPREIVPVEILRNKAIRWSIFAPDRPPLPRPAHSLVPSFLFTATLYSPRRPTPHFLSGRLVRKASRLGGDRGGSVFVTEKRS